MFNFPDYLKKYSIINSKFIDDFFGLHEYKIDLNDIYIDFDLVTKWLKSRRDHLKETLLRSYINKIDYTIIKKKSIRGRPRDIIKLSYSTFKRLCLLSRTQKAEEVRTYFIEIEKHLMKYKDYIIEALDKKVDVLKNNQKIIPIKQSGVVYILHTDLDIDGIYKIGKSKAFKQRIATHNSSHVNNVDIKLIFETNDINTVEACVKALLKKYQYKKRKEFYQVDIDYIKELLNGCESLLLSHRNTKKNKNIQNGGYFIYLHKN